MGPVPEGFPILISLWAIFLNSKIPTELRVLSQVYPYDFRTIVFLSVLFTSDFSFHFLAIRLAFHSANTEIYGYYSFRVNNVWN